MLPTRVYPLGVSVFHASVELEIFVTATIELMHNPADTVADRYTTSFQLIHNAFGHWTNVSFKNKNKKIGHHARPRSASATAPLRTGADTLLSQHYHPP